VVGVHTNIYCTQRHRKAAKAAEHACENEVSVLHRVAAKINRDEAVKAGSHNSSTW